MMIIGCDFHTRYQQIAMAEDSTGELLLERRLDHQNGDARRPRKSSNPAHHSNAVPISYLLTKQLSRASMGNVAAIRHLDAPPSASRTLVPLRP
jgi:hypothetical protein